jgi:hypothetical protein
MVGIELPGEDRLPPGPARDLVAALHELYRRAGRPGLRTISKSIIVGDFRDTVSHEAVSGMLHGKSVPRWSKLECVVRQLADWNSPRVDPDQTASRFLSMWEAATGAIPSREPQSVLSGIARTTLLPSTGNMPVLPKLPQAAITGELRWREPADDQETAQVRALRDNQSSHPAFARSSSQPIRPLTVRVGVSLPCTPLPATQPNTSDVRSRFLEFLSRPPATDLVMTLTPVNDDRRWEKWAGHGRTNHEALLTLVEHQEEPAAWARILIPEPQMPASWRDPRCADFLMHVLRRRTAQIPPHIDLINLHRLLIHALSLPTALAHFLREDLGLTTVDEPAASVMVWIDTPDALSNFVDIGNCQPLPGSPSSPRFESYAVLDAKGLPVADMAIEWIRQMCDNTLHVDNYESLLSALKQ